MRISIPGCALVLLGCGGSPELVGDVAAERLAPVVADVAAERREPGAADLRLMTGSALDDDAMLPDARLQSFARGTLPNPEHAPCLFGTSDATGHVALGRGVGDDAVWSFYSGHGAPLGTATGNSDPLNGDALGSQIFPARDGFQIVAQRSGLGVGGLLVAFAVDGSRLAESPISGRRDAGLYLSSIPSGGVTVSTFSDLALSARLSWFDDHGALVADEDVFFGPPYDDRRTLIATDTRGHTLALYPGLSGLRARWFNLDGSARGDELLLALPAGALLSPLIGGGFAVRSGDEWTGVIASDGTAIAAAPEWLRHRPRTRLVIVHDGDLYALVFDDGATTPSRPQVIELRRANGAWAGALLAWPPRGPFASQRTSIGRDGTLVQLLSRTRPEGPECHYRWWPRLFDSGVNGDGTSVCIGACP